MQLKFGTMNYTEELNKRRKDVLKEKNATSFFQDNVLIDDDNLPIIFFHASKSYNFYDFDSFKYSKDLGYHFGTLEQVTDITHYNKENKFIMPVFVTMSKPLILKDGDSWDSLHMIYLFKDKI